MESKILVDYAAFTVSEGQFLEYEELDFDGQFERMCHAFGFGRIQQDFEQRGGYHGYLRSWWYNGITLAAGGNGTVHVNMSGTGCRCWETLNKGQTWENYIKHLQSTYSSLHVSRLDVACDTVALLPLPLLQRWVRNGWYISKWRTYLIQDGNVEKSIVFGSSKSDFRLRIYDKTLERRRVVDHPEDVPEGWTRCEFQLRNESAAAFIREWLPSDIGTAFCGIMRNQLQFTKDYDGVHPDRITPARWWKKLLGDAEKLKMAYPGGVEYNYQKLSRYVFKQAGSSIRAYIEWNRGDLTEFLKGVNGARLNDRQQELLRLRPELTEVTPD